MNYTSVKQSVRLMELGLNPETSDMCYSEMGINNKMEPFYGILAEPLLPETKGIPAWSVGALLEAMPKFTEPCGIYVVKVAVPQLIRQNKWVCNYKGDLEALPTISGCTISGVCTEGDTPLDAAYNMIVWLLEHGFIKSSKKVPKIYCVKNVTEIPQFIFKKK